ncbi:mitochondrial fission regulator 2 [Anguilla rostrata]|uniref:mitochondrial fission regulator 2 n=1 Tax=Anguilla rostrata TaxID=7938 RepID=UPI0030CF19EC
MSLLADILDLLRNLLEYFGVPADMLVPVWDNQYCGQYRSIVRMIGTNLPLSPQARVHFQIPLQSFERHGTADFPLNGPVIPSFADVMWLTEDDGEVLTKFRNDVRPLGRHHASQRLPAPPALALAPARGFAELRGSQPPANTEALSKITALEGELLRLRAQIAMIVTMPSGTAPFQNAPATPGGSSPPPPPVLTSTPAPAPRCPPPPPPPPPPLPPHCPAAMETQAHGPIRQPRRTASREEQDQKDRRTGSPSEKAPSMLDVLKDLNQVKLRAVERSPGGTPVMKRSKKAVDFGDPAALIAEALKRKFAHRRKEDSFDKENRSFELSPFGSPEIPSIPFNIRCGQGRLHL